MLELARNSSATLATAGHVYCSGTVAQCLYRWQRLAPEKQAGAFLKIGRDGVAPTIVQGAELAELASRRDLFEDWMR